MEILNSISCVMHIKKNSSDWRLCMQVEKKVQHNIIQYNTTQYKYITNILANRKTYLKPEFTESRIYIKQTSVFFALRYCLGFVKQVFALQICIQDKLPHYYAIQILSLLHSSSLLQKHHMTQAKPAKCHHKHQEHCRGRNRRTFSGLYE